MAAVLLAGLTIAPARAATADDPTWAEVRAAKLSVSAKAAEVTKIRAVLSALEARAAQLGTVAIRTAAAAAAAHDRLAAAESVLQGLRARAAGAQKRAGRARRTAGAVATQLYRSGDPTLAVWLSGERAGSLLYRLGALARIGGSSSALLQQAVPEQRQAQALGSEAEVQAGIRDALAKKAAGLANTAKRAQQAADAAVTGTKQHTARLRAQLAALQASANTLQASYAAAQAAKRAAAAAGDGGGGGGSLGSSPSGPGSLSPGAAQNYAASRLGAYGWSSGQMGCLISLWNIESGWRWNAYNASSGAYGIPQSLPGDKMATAGADWTTSSSTQIEWGLGYIRSRYGSPCSAYAFETSHTPYWY